MIRMGLALAVAIAVGCGGGAARAPDPAHGQAAAVSAAPLAPPPAMPRVRVGTVWVRELGPAAARATDHRVTLLDGVDEAQLGTLRGGGFGVGGGIIGSGAPGGIGIRVSRGRRRPAQIHPGRVVSSSGLDRAIIQRILRAYLPRIRYCYERRLRVNPHLAGRLQVAFTIDGNGRVIRVNSTGLDPSVGRCVEQVVHIMRFPRPQGGGLVNVRYPFIFTPSGGAAVGGVIGPPPTPAPPVSQVRVKAAEPLPDAPLPAPVAAAGGDAPPGPGRCVVADRPDGLASVAESVSLCYGKALQRHPGLVVRLDVLARVDAAGRVSGATVLGGDDALDACASDAVRALVLSGAAADAVRGKTIAFTLALDKAGGAPPAEQRVVATTHDLRLGLRSIASEIPWREVGTLQLQAWRQINKESHDDAGAPLVLRADNDLSSGVVLAALTALPDRGVGLRFARDRGDGDWKVVNPLGSAKPAAICGKNGPASRVTVLIDGTGFWLATERGHVRVRRDRGQWDMIGFARQLRAIRREELRDRSDLELAATSSVPYEVFAKALEISVETGFFDATVKTYNTIANPRNRPPRR